METVGNRNCNTSELEGIHLFRSSNLPSLQGLLQRCPVRQLQCGQTLLTKGQPNYTIYLLLSGCLKVHLDDAGADSPITLEGGDSVGEMSVIDNQLTSATVVAETDCRLLVIEEETLWSLVDRSPVVARNLLQAMTQRLRFSNSLICSSRQLQRTYEQYAVTDPLTGLYNRRWLEDMLPRQMLCCAETSQPCSLFIADIDFFKDFNDTHGHLAGDRAIQGIAETLQSSLRKSDQAVRFGGEEFLVLLPAADIEEARIIAERVRRAVRDTPLARTDGRALPSVTISIGIGEMTPEHTPETFINVADAALYRAKERGRDSVVV